MSDGFSLFGGVDRSRPESVQAPMAVDRSTTSASGELPAAGDSGQVAAAVLGPIREEAARLPPASDADAERRFRRVLDEVLYDIREGLTAHSAARARTALQTEVPAWFERRRAQEKERDAEMARMAEAMGKALKAIHGDDQRFHGQFDQHMQRMRQAAGGASAGAAARGTADKLLQIIDDATHELEQKRQAEERHMRQLSEMVRGLHQQLDEVRGQAQTDGLTGLFNRKSFDERLSDELKKSRLTPYHFCLIMIDLDHFKQVNDSHGHVAGDKVLAAAAKAIQAVVLRKEDFCARCGGEEMAVLLADCGAVLGLRTAEAIRQRIASIVLPGAGRAEIRPTASLGVAEGLDSDTPEDLVARADKALYAAKHWGRNRVEVAGQRPAGAGAGPELAPNRVGSTSLRRPFPPVPSRR